MSLRGWESPHKKKHNIKLVPKKTSKKYIYIPNLKAFSKNKNQKTKKVTYFVKKKTRSSEKMSFRTQKEKETKKDCPSKTIFKKKKKFLFPRASVHGYNGRDERGPRVNLKKRVRRPDWTLARATLPLKKGDLVEAQTCCPKPLPTKVLEMSPNGEEVVLADLPRCLPKRKGFGRRLGSDSDSDGEKSACQQKNHDLETLERKQRAEREKLFRQQKTVPADAVRHRDYLLPGEINSRNFLKVLTAQLLPLLPTAKKGDFVEDLEDATMRDAGLYIIGEKEGALSISILEGERGSGSTRLGEGFSLGPKYPVGYWHRAKFAQAYFSSGYGRLDGNGCKEPVDVSVWGLITEEDLTEIEGDACAREYSWGTLCFPAKKSVVISELLRLKNQGTKLLYFYVDQPDGPGKCIAHLDLDELEDEESYEIFK